MRWSYSVNPSWGKANARRLSGAFESGGTDDDLQKRVLRDLSFLFREYGAEIISNNYYPRSFGSSIIEVGCANLRFRIVKDKREHEIRLDIGPSHVENFWESFEEALSVATGRPANSFRYRAEYDDDISQPTYIGLTQIASILQSSFSALDEAFSVRCIEKTKMALGNRHGYPWATSFNLREGAEPPTLIPPNIKKAQNK
jgi:hypothetical protein